MEALGRQIIDEKHAQVAELLPTCDFDAWLVFSREATDPICPLVVGTRFVGTAAFVFGRRTRIAICADYDAMAVEETGAFDRVIPYSVNFASPLITVLRELRPGRIGINYSKTDDRADGLSHGMFLVLREIVQEALPDATLVSAAPLAQGVRAHKSPEETRRIEAAVGIAEQIFQEMRSFIRVGRTEMEIGRFAEGRAEQLGAKLAEDALPIVATGKAGLGHRGPSDATLTAGDVVVVDMAISYQGYHSDFTRTFYAPGEDGRIPDSLRFRFETVRDAIEIAKTMIRPGMRGYEPKEAADAFIESRGIPAPRFGLGHQVGTACHDGGLSLAPRTPRYAGRVEAAIQAGTVFTLEPFLVPSPGESAFPIGIEEMILVEAEGCRWLTAPQREVWCVNG